jgi:hypothetical protein
VSTVESFIEVQIERALEDEQYRADLAVALERITALADRADQVRALRAARGKHLSPAARGVLTNITEQVGRLK